MPGVKAGTAYVAIELSRLHELRRQIGSEVVTALSAAGRNGSTALARQLSGRLAAQRIARDLSSGLSNLTSGIIMPLARGISGLFGNAGTSSGSAFAQRLGASLRSAIAGGGSLAGFQSALASMGTTSSAGFVSTFRAGLSGLGPAVQQSASNAIAGFRSLGSAASTAIGQIPNMVARMSDGLIAFSRKLGMVGYQMQTFGVLASLAFTLPVAGIIGLGAAIGIKFAVQVEDATAALKALTPRGYDVAALIKRLQQLAIASPVFDSASVIVFTQRMAAAGLSISKTERFLKAFGNIAVSTSTPMEKVSRALEAFAQMAGKGVVNMEELRQQLGDALPSAMKVAADGLGVTQAKLFEMVKSGDVTADMLMNAFIKVGESAQFVTGAAAGADTLRSRWNALKESFQTNLGNAILKHMDKIKAALAGVQPTVDLFVESFVAGFPKAIDAVKGLLDKINELINKWKGLGEDDQALIKKIIMIAVVVGPIVVVLGSLGVAIAGLVAGFGMLFSTAGLVFIAIAALAVGFIKLKNWIKDLYANNEKFRDTIQEIVDKFNQYLKPTLNEIVGILKGSFKEAWDSIKDAINKSKGSFDGIQAVLKAIGIVALVVVGILVGLFVGFWKAVGPLIAAVGSLIGGVIKIVVGVVSFIYNLFTGNFEEADKAIRLIWSGLWDAIFMTVWNIGKAIWNFISGFVEGIVGFFQMMYDILVGHSIVPDMINAIIEWFMSLPGRVVSLISGMVDSVISWFTRLKAAVVSYVAGLVTSAKEKFSELREAFGSIASAVRDKVVSLMEDFSRIPGRIMSALGNLGSLLYNSGRQVIQGLINGISDMAGAVMSKARDIANSVKDTISGALDINSPSRVMEILGKYIPEGLANGIISGIGLVENTMSRMADAIIAPIASSSGNIVTVDQGAEARRAASLYIENYVSPTDASPEQVAESLMWVNSVRGWA